MVVTEAKELFREFGDRVLFPTLTVSDGAIIGMALRLATAQPNVGDSPVATSRLVRIIEKLREECEQIDPRLGRLFETDIELEELP